MNQPPYGNQPPGRPYQPYVQQGPPPQYGYDPYGGGGGGGGYAPAAADLPLAPIHRRAGARLIDSIIVWAFGFAVVFPISVGVIGVDQGAKNNGDTPWTTPLLWTFFVVVCLLPFLYEAALLTISGQTLGKRFLGLSVVDANPAGEPLQLPKAIWRSAINNIGYQLPAFFFLLLGVLFWSEFVAGMFLAWAGALLSYLWAIWDHPLHQSVHDRFAGTVVVDDREYEDGEAE